MKKILVVDDDAHYRKVLEYILLKEGYEVISCSSGDKALEQIRENDFLLIVTDYRMGRISGLDIAGAAASKSPSIPVIMVTGHSDIVMRGISEAAIRRVFTKPISLKSLIDAVKAIDSKEFLAPGVVNPQRRNYDG